MALALVDGALRSVAGVEAAVAVPVTNLIHGQVEVEAMMFQSRQKYLYPRVERESWPSARRGGESVSTRKRIYTMSVSWLARAALLGDWGYRPRYLCVAGTLQPMRLYSTVQYVVEGVTGLG